jgi:branched-chain amino acid transport system ATP-binding protein
MALLEVDDIHTFYGNIEALKGISLTVEEGEVVTLIGSNGAGKSTTLRSISGITPPRTGSIRFDGREIAKVPPQEIVSFGISQSPEGRHCFQRMSVRENLDMGAYLRRDKEIGQDMERVFELFPRLQERERQKAGTMSGGEQQMLAIGRALMARPKLLLLDEPAAGLDAHESQELSHALRRLLADGLAIFIIDHDMGLMMSVCDYVYVLDFGRIIAHGTPAAIRFDPTVIAAYLGSDSAEVEA